MQITVHPPDFAGDKNIDFEFPNACWWEQNSVCHWGRICGSGLDRRLPLACNERDSQSSSFLLASVHHFFSNPPSMIISTVWKAADPSAAVLSRHWSDFLWEASHTSRILNNVLRLRVSHFSSWHNCIYWLIIVERVTVRTTFGISIVSPLSRFINLLPYETF